MRLQEKIGKYLNEGKGNQEFAKMKTIVNNVFTNNKKFDFKVKEYPSIGSFTIKGDDVKTILQVLDASIGDSKKLFADYGYGVEKYPSQKTVLLKNFDMFTDNKWKTIWKN